MPYAVGAVSGAPDPKSRTLARGERRYRRKVASPKRWAAIRDEKLEGALCRACFVTGISEPLELHHLVPRDLHGDDVADNLIAVCRDCHRAIEAAHPLCLSAIARRLSDAEYAYVVGKLGEGALERLFGVSAR